MTSPILVTGGTGTLGSLVVRRLRSADIEVRVLSRRSREPQPGVRFFTGDLRTGEGVGPAVEGVATIVHCAGSATGDAALTDVLVRAALRAGAPHIVYISVVGTDRIPVAGFGRVAFGYFASKLEAERVVSSSGLPWTTLRATQFHELFLTVSKALARLPVVPVPARFRFQPVDADEVAARLVQLVLGEPAGQVADLGGPRVYLMADLLRIYLRAAHRHRLLLPLWLPGKSARAIRAGGNLVSAQDPSRPAEGGRTWEEFLAESLLDGGTLGAGESRP